MARKRRKRGITPWKRSLLRFSFVLLLIAAGLHLFRLWKAAGFEDQREAARWGAERRSAQVSAFLPARSAMKEEQILELEYKINTGLTQDSIKLTAEGPDAKLWLDCYSGVGNLTIRAGGKTVDVEAVGTGGAFFTFHPLKISGGSYYSSDSLMKDEILLDEETAWKLFGAFDVEGRTVQVEDMHLTIAGVYKNDKDKLYEQAGLSPNVVFVQYKTLLQYGGGDAGEGAGGTGMETGASLMRPAAGSTMRLGTGTSDVRTAPRTATASNDGSMTIELDDAQGSGGTDAAGASSGADASGASAGTGNAAATGSQTDESSGISPNGTSDSNKPNMENVGTGNTAYKDTGKITIYEIVMPDPVEGNAAAALMNALGEDSGAVVVDNTNRFGERSLISDIRNIALLGMRTQAVRYPYWENYAMGWETIFMVLFLAECLLIIVVILFLLLMLVHWYRHRSWTVASGIRGVQDSIYERQSRRRYPEYYEDTEREFDEEQSEEAQTAMGVNSGNTPKSGLLEDKGAIPFERIREERKAVKVEREEALYTRDQRDDGSGTGPDAGGMRREQQ